MHQATRIFWVLIATLTIAWQSSSILPTLQEEGEEWSELQIVFQDDSGVANSKPAVVAVDQTGTAHLLWFYKEDVSDEDSWAISYASWSNGLWSEPNDVLITPGGGAGEPRVQVGTDDDLHVIWPDQRTIWYSKSHLQEARDARSWSTPAPIASRAVEADLTVDAEGHLHVVFVTGESRGPVHHIRSVDNGESWSRSVEIYSGSPNNVTSAHPRVSVDGNGWIHVTWTEFQIPAGWPPLGQLYARSEDGGETWEGLTQVASGEAGQGTVLAVEEDDVHLVWRGTSAAGNSYHQWSADGGRNWRAATVFDPDGGFSGGHTLAADSVGRLHLVRGDGGYQRWEDFTWAPVPALYADSGETGTLAIGPDDRLHWINTSSNSSPVALVMHRTLKLEVEEISPTPKPTLTSTPPPTVTPLAEEGQPADPTPAIGLRSVGHRGSSSSVANAFMVGMLPAGLLIGLVVLLRFFMGRSEI